MKHYLITAGLSRAPLPKAYAVSHGTYTDALSTAMQLVGVCALDFDHDATGATAKLEPTTYGVDYVRVAECECERKEDSHSVAV